MKKYSLLQSTSIMLNELYKNNGLNRIVNLAASLIDAPVCVISTNNKILATSDESQFNDTYMKPFLESGYLSEAENERMYRGKLLDKLYFSSVPFSSFRGNDYMIHSSVRLNGLLFAHIVAYGFYRTLDDSDLEMLSMITKIITLEFQKSHFYQDDNSSVKSSQLIDLLNNDRPPKAPLIRGWNPKKNTIILFIGRKGQSTEDENIFRNFVKYLRSLLSGDVVAQNDAGIIALITDYEPFESGNQKYDNVQELLSSSGFSAGVSNHINNMEMIREHYNEAKEAYHINRLLEEQKPMTHYSEAAFFIVLSLIDRSKDIESLRYPPIETLKQYDSEKKTEYYQTLKAYLSCSRDPSATADFLHIHKNTVFYRIGKIRELLGVDLDDTSVLFNIIMSINIDVYLEALDHKNNLSTSQ